MPRQCRDRKCIANKEKLTVHKYKNKEKDPTPSSTPYRNSLSISTASQNRKQECAEPKRSKDDSESSKPKKCRVSQSTSGSSILTRLRQKLHIKSTNTFERISGSSQNYIQQICTCRKNERHNPRSGSSHGHANSQNVSTESRKRRKRSRRRYKKTSKRESDQLRHDCFTTLCICVRGRNSNELRACNCMSSREILSSDHECCCVQTRRRKKTNRLAPKTILKNDIQTGRHTSSVIEQKPRLKHPNELSEERNVIIKELDTICKEINRFGARTIRLFKSKN
ncbi:uncharacterized protein LOC112638447 [Camponotus floridanus]|uniref:uncharacterized protein LOC112638447 n=1 Tax=Camponotus floridanus TaxID=104421 RepID=UPI000DC67E2E|nr:uncharacterized protein LOC112638447 [Camponotus floridanus]